MTFIAGPYTSTWNALATGITQDGYEEEYARASDEVTGDNLGDTVQDEVTRGITPFAVNFLCNEYDAAALATMTWVDHATRGRVGQVGRLASALAQPLVLTRVAGTTATLATITYAKSLIDRNFTVRTKFAARLRQIGLRLKVFPVTDGQSVTTFFATT